MNEGVSCKETILDNLITANRDLFEKKIETFLKRITKKSKNHHSSKQFKELKLEQQSDLFFQGGYSLKSIITNDDIISRIKQKQHTEFMDRIENANDNIFGGYEYNNSPMINISVPYKRNIIRPTSVNHKSKTNNNFIRQLTNTIESI